MNESSSIWFKPEVNLMIGSRENEENVKKVIFMEIPGGAVKVAQLARF